MIAGLKRIAVVLGVVAVATVAGYYGWRWYDSSRDVQVTNNAYVRGEITTISSRVAGYAVEVLVDDNMSVAPAQILVRIDPRDFRMNVDKAQATLDQAKANLAEIGAQRELEKSKIAVAEAAVRSAQAESKNAEVTQARAATLARQNFGTQAALDAATAAAAVARAGIDQAQANLAFEQEQVAVIDSNEEVAQAQLEAAQAALLSAKFALGDTEIWAPIAGIVANRQTRVGEYVSPGTLMLSIVPTQNLWIEANYRETQIGRMRVGDPVRVAIDTYPGKQLCGYVESIAPASGAEFALIPPDNATGNFTKIVRRFAVRIRFNVRESNASLARPGMSVETAVAVATTDNAPAAERAALIGCSFDPTRDIVERVLTKLPEHPGLGRARPQGAAGTQVSP